MRRTSYLAIIISILAVAVRFILIDQPFIDHWSWRQSDVAAIARNYFQNGFHFAYPQIDWAGGEPGYVGTEFPVLPFLAALSYKISGIHEWIGRLQTIVLFALSLPFFFLLVRKIFGEIAALWSLGFYGFAPLGIMASRCFMPDVPSLTLSIIGLYFFERWIESEPERQPKLTSSFVWSALFIALSILIKATSVLIGVPLACLAFQRFKWRALREIDLWIFAAIALLPSAIWYGHAYQIAQQFYPHHFFGAGGVKIMSLAWYWGVAKQIPTSTLTPVLFLMGAAGLFVARMSSKARPFYCWLAAMLVFMVIVGYGNRHPWYQLSLVPIFAAFAGAACAHVMSLSIFADARSHAALFMRAGFAIALIAFAAFALRYAQWFYEPTAAPMRDAGLILKKISMPVSLIVAADNGDPTIFYYAERRGWHFLETGGIYNGEPINSAQAITNLEALRKRGANFLVFTSNTSWWLDYHAELGHYIASNSTPVEATPEFKIYKLQPMSR
jgi:4-amino-4-deoxy-L-arabinose transferase and related glycosyltransferases of PMT family